MFKLATKLCQSTGYWLLVFLFALSLELIALFFQYQFGYGPCVLCVEIRALIFGVMLLAIVGMLAASIRLISILLNVGITACGISLYLKAEHLLKIERNLVESACGFKANFPSWLPLDKWLPSVFEPWEACGYTPMMWLDYTMAEALIYCSYFVIGLGLAGLLLNLFFTNKRNTDLDFY